MRRKWLIDAHNLMHKLPHAGEAYSRNRLEGITVVLQCMGQLCRKYNRSAQLVFDGHPIHIPDQPDSLKIEFSGNKPADLIIRNILRKKKSRNQWTVVSDDHEVRFYARQAGCDVVPVKELTAEFTTDQKLPDSQSDKPLPGEDPGIELDEHEVEEWKNIFGID